MGISDHLTCLLRDLYAGQEAAVGAGHGTTNWFRMGKGVHQGCILSEWVNLIQMTVISTTMGMNPLEEME